MIFDHVGLVVSDLSSGRAATERLLAITEWTAEYTDPVHKVHVQFGRPGPGIVYELVAPIDGTSPVAAALQAERNILNHLAYRADAFDSTAGRLRSEGAMPLGPAAPAVAFGGARVQFFLTPMRFVLELIDSTIAPSHRFGPARIAQP